MVELTLEDILNAKGLWDAVGQLRLRPKDAHKIMSYIRDVVQPELEKIDEQRKKLIEHYNTSEEGETAQVDGDKEPETFEKFIKEFGEYLETVIKIKPLMLTMDQFLSATTVNGQNAITGNLLLHIEKFLKEDEETRKKKAAAKRAQTRAKKKVARKKAVASKSTASAGDYEEE